MPNKVLSTTFKADGDLLNYMKQTGAGADSLKAKLVELKESAKAKGGDEEEGGGGIANIRKQLGSRSALGQVGSILTGGMAVGGVTLLAKALGDAAEKATQLKHQFDEGKISAGGVAAGIAESLPVLGTMIGAFDKVGNLLASFPALADSWAGKMLGLSDRKYAEEIQQQETARKALLDYQADALERQKKTMAEMATMARRTGRETAGADLDGAAKEAFDRQAQNADKLAELESKRQQALDEAEKDRRAKAADIGKQDVGTNLKVEMESRLAKATADEKARINREFDAQAKNQQAASHAEDAAATRRHLESMARVYAGYSKEITDADATAQADQLKAAGRTFEAETLLARRAADDKKRAIDQALAEQMKQAANPMERQMLQADADAAKAAVDRSAESARQVAAYKDLRDLQVQSLQAQAAAGDESAAAELKRLQATREYEQRAANIADLLRQQGLSTAARAELEQDQARLKSAEQERVAKEVRDQHDAALQERAEHGATFAQRRAAGKELAADQVKHEFERRQAAAQSIQNDKNATAEQKRQAAEDLKSFAEMAGREFDDKVYGKRQRVKNDFSADENQGLLTGVGESARARRDPTEDVLAASKEGNKLTGDLLKTAGGILAALTGGKPPAQQRSIFGH